LYELKGKLLSLTLVTVVFNCLKWKRFPSYFCFFSRLIPGTAGQILFLTEPSAKSYCRTLTDTILLQTAVLQPAVFILFKL